VPAPHFPPKSARKSRPKVTFLLYNHSIIGGDQFFLKHPTRVNWL
jgi:hypothetical protein